MRPQSLYIVERLRGRKRYPILVNGVRYTRCNNSYTTDYFLGKIKEELGDVILAKAIYAVSQHLEYYEDLRKTKLLQIREIRDRYSTQLATEDRAVYPDDLPTGSEYVEGKSKQILVNVYERNFEARTVCLKYYGHDCTVCGFNFEKRYGETGKGRIHVHHLVEISTIKSTYKIDPVKDLRPVCPNCHMMIHSKQPAHTLEEIKAILKSVASAT